MIEVKYNPDLDGKTKVILEFNSDYDRAFNAIFVDELLGIGANGNGITGNIETSNPTHIRRIHGVSKANTNIDRDSLIAVGCIKDV